MMSALTCVPQEDKTISVLAQRLGVSQADLMQSAHLIQRKTFLSGRAWLRLLQEQQQPATGPYRLWRLHKRFALLQRLSRQPCFDQAEQRMLQEILDALSVSFSASGL